MPTLAEIMSNQRDVSIEPTEEDVNRFLPGGVIGNSLGLLDLTFGAPARAVQQGILSVSRGEGDPIEVLHEMLKAGAGIGGKGFGRGELASGMKLLEEAGVIEDKENIGNILLGVGVDVVTDIATFNLIGAAKRAGLGAGRGAVKALAPEGVRFRKSGDFLVKDPLESRKVKAFLFDRLSETREGRAKFLRELRRSNDASRILARRIFRFRKGEGGETEFLRARKELINEFDFENVQLRFTGGRKDLQEALLKPSAAELGKAVGETGEAIQRAGIETLEGAGSILDDLDRGMIEVKDFTLASKHLGSNRPNTLLEFRFPNAGRILRDKIPNDMNRRFPTDIDLRFVDVKPKVLERILPSWVDPFDFRVLLRETGLVAPFAAAHNNFVRELFDVRKEADDLFKAIGAAEGNAVAVKLGKAAEDPNIFATLTLEEQRVVREVQDLETRLARTRIPDGKGGFRQIVPDEHLGDRNTYLHRIREDQATSAEVAKNFLFEHATEDGTKVQFNYMSDVHQSVKPGFTMKRTSPEGAYSFDIAKSVKSYISGALKKKHFDPVLRETFPIIQRLNRPETVKLFNVAEDWINSLMGNYSRLDQHFDSLMDAIPGAKQTMKTLFGAERNIATRMSTSVVGSIFRSTLGANPRTALLQVIQGWVNNGIQFGLMDSLKGFFRATAGQVKGENRRLRSVLRESKILNGAIRETAQEFGTLFDQGVLGRPIGKALKVLDRFLFAGLNGFDNLNRAWAFHAGVGAARRAGLSEQSSILHGLKAANETQFIYGKLGGGPARNNPLGRVLLQFQSYAVKQLSFLTQKLRQDPGTNLLRYLAMTGVLVRNVGSQIDVSAELVPTTPGDIADIVTLDRIPALVAVEAVTDFGKAMLQEAAGVPNRGEAIDPEFAKEQLKRAFFSSVVPGGNMFHRFAKFTPTLEQGIEESEDDLTRAVLGAAALPGRALSRIPGVDFTGSEVETGIGLRTGARGREKDKFGRTIRDLSPQEAVLGIVGFRTTEARLRREAFEDERFVVEMMKSRYGKMMTDAVRAAENGRDPGPFLLRAQRIKQESAFAINRVFRQRLKNNQLSLIERQRKRFPRAFRREGP